MEGEKTPETLRFSTETITGKELLAQILVDDKPDPRFLPVEEGGVFHFSPLNPFSEIRKDGVFYSLLKLNERIVGLGALQIAPGEENVLWFQAISIDENLKGQGYSDRLLREMFSFAKSKKAKLWISSPTREGRERTRYKLKDLSKKYGVELFGSGGEPFTE